MSLWLCEDEGVELWEPVAGLPLPLLMTGEDDCLTDSFDLEELQTNNNERSFIKLINNLQ